MTADTRTKAAAWIAIVASVVSMLALNGKAALDALAAFPALASAWASGLPLGLWSCLLSAAVAGGLHWWARTWHGRSFALEVATFVVAVGVTVSQLAVGQGFEATAPQLLSAIWIGLLAGILGLLASRALLAAQGRQ